MNARKDSEPVATKNRTTVEPKSEREITDLLKVLSRENPRRLVINVTHSLASLEAFDSVLVMYQGRLVFHGPSKLLTHYFTVDHPEEVYLRLTQRDAQAWHESWQKKREYYEKMLLETAPAQPKRKVDSEQEDEDIAPEELPGVISQVFTLLQRRWTIFRRDSGQVWLHSMNLDLMIYGGKPLPPEMKEQALKVRNTLYGIMKAAAEGDF